MNIRQVYVTQHRGTNLFFEYFVQHFCDLWTRYYITINQVDHKIVCI